MTSCDRLFCLVALGITLLITTKPGKARLQRKTRQLDIFDEFEDFDIPGSCPQGWIEHDGSCYTPFAHGATWQEAEDTCREIDSHLALSRGATENEFIAVEVGRPESRVWIGLRRIEGEFVWSDGRKADYTNWGRGEPKGGSDCVSLLPEDIFHSWEVTECNVMQAFICERDQDECLTDRGGCVETANCVNTEGSYLCECKNGYFGDGTTCEDIDECSSPDGNNCSVYSSCNNTDGSYICTCNRGFTGDGFTCSDQDECFIDEGGCADTANCVNTEGSFFCECKNGYVGDGTICADVDECSSPGANNCSLNATCSNTNGSYTCACNKGFSGDGFNCSDKDECVADRGGCVETANCVNTEGSFHCECKRGYSGDGTTCEDIDECSLPNANNCSLNATCSNTNGSYICACNRGFNGDGFNCSEAIGKVLIEQVNETSIVQSGNN
ncbi:adhesion G protein-coupled receptor E1-like [Montipora capricornis]|uniref:adhesion G protein-coupled receptor E1-like n=1 Tax=Montipora capricornis TaxID=246305 RepID=UPI0035F1AF83